MLAFGPAMTILHFVKIVAGVFFNILGPAYQIPARLIICMIICVLFLRASPHSCHSFGVKKQEEEGQNA
jgi:hypothetical protein